MAAETSNAREWKDWMRDREQVVGLADHLEQVGWRQDERGDVQCFDQGAAMAAEVIRLVLLPMLDAPPPAAAEPKTLPVPTHVYLTDKAAVIVGDPQRGWDEEGPEAHNCDDMGCSTIGPHVLARVPFTDERALSQQPEARGVVDEGSRAVTNQLLHWGGIPVRVTGTVTTSPGNWPLIDATLTGERNG